MLPFTVCMSVYKNDKVHDVSLAIESVLNQTIKPDEVIVVIDGPISSDLYGVLNEYSTKGFIKIINHPKNLGLGNALRTAVTASSNEIIARMDSDDISVHNRFEKQLACFEADSSLSIVGGGINEFIDSPTNVIASRICPCKDKDIKNYMKTRCAFNHVTVMFKKTDVLDAGNYQDWHYNEDYYLWIRMMLAGCKFENLEDVLVNVRVGKDMYARRGGWRYFKSEAQLQKYMLTKHVISLPLFLYNVLGRFIVEVMMTNRMRAFIFQKFLRK